MYLLSRYNKTIQKKSMCVFIYFIYKYYNNNNDDE